VFLLLKCDQGEEVVLGSCMSKCSWSFMVREL